jgi:hypothetical protein
MTDPVGIVELRALLETSNARGLAWMRSPTGKKIADALPALLDEIERLREAQQKIKSISLRMAEDEGLWFRAQTAAEAYLQQELRKLCAAIEGGF